MSTMMIRFILTLVIHSLINGVTEGSLYDPHLTPATGPFFEGWYLRITDITRDDSLGLLFGNVLPVNNTTSAGNPLVLASVLFRECAAKSDVDNLIVSNWNKYKLIKPEQTRLHEPSIFVDQYSDRKDQQCRLAAMDGKYSLNDLKITVNGHAVNKNPDVSSPPNFKWEVNTEQGGGYFQQVNGTTVFDFKIGELSLRGKASHPEPWNAAGTGPEGWLGYLPLPLHWFVYSLRSKLDFYEIQNTTSGIVTRGSHGYVHLEKNWGESFPERWIWSEGVSTDGNASFSLSGGKVTFLDKFSVDAYLIGYRNPSTGLALDFRPDNSVVSAQIDGCTGMANLTVNGLSYKLTIKLYASINSFSGCLYGPEAQGFRHACVESYDAHGEFEVYKRQMLPRREELVESHMFTGVGLEFGGTSVCKNKCA